MAPTAKSTYGSGQLQPSTTQRFINQPGQLPQVSPTPDIADIVGYVLNGAVPRNRRRRTLSKIRAGHRHRAHNH